MSKPAQNDSMFRYFTNNRSSNVPRHLSIITVIIVVIVVCLIGLIIETVGVQTSLFQLSKHIVDFCVLCTYNLHLCYHCAKWQIWNDLE